MAVKPKKYISEIKQILREARSKAYATINFAKAEASANAFYGNLDFI